VAQARVDTAQAGVTAAEGALTQAGQTLCGAAGGYVEALDRYGKVFSDNAATVGDVRTLGADLTQPRDAVTAAGADVEKAKADLVTAQQELIDAEAALTVAQASASSKPVPSTTAETATTTTLAPPATVERVKQAEDDFAQAAKGITDATPLAEATAEFNSAALALELAWLRLMSDGGCLTDDQQKQAVELVATYTTNLQTQLKQVGYYEGEIDGIYGPQTTDGVKKLQADSKLPETGFVDQATAAALDAKLAAKGQQAANVQLTQTATVQTVLKLTGFWNGPIDGKWTDDLTAALKEFQTKLGVKPTGVVDAATLAAFEESVAAVKVAVTASPSAPVTVTKSASVPVTVTASASKPATVTVTATTTAPATSKSTGVDLSGKWNGKYSGNYTGTFVLDWEQTGSKLSGTIMLSAPAATLSLNGTITGTTIDFGTVGSTEITYTGKVSGDSMSGTYSVNGAPGGDWSATRAS
jgi:peptidoglycan hydrolase-like protein with peptidoglycan-binding domain